MASSSSQPSSSAAQPSPAHPSSKRRRGEVIDLTGDEEIDLTGDDDADAAVPCQRAKRDCVICLELLGTNGGVSALECMCTFCKSCIATHIQTQNRAGLELTCPGCRHAITREVAGACGAVLDLSVPALGNGRDGFDLLGHMRRYIQRRNEVGFRELILEALRPDLREELQQHPDMLERLSRPTDPDQWP